MTTASLLETGQLEHVTKVAQRLTGRRPSPATVWRWCRKGLRGGTLKLEACFHAGAWQTSETAFVEFIDRQTAAQREPAPGATDEALSAAGLL